MKSIDSIIKHLSISIILPGLTFVLFWWAPASFKLFGLGEITDETIAFSAITGLLIGLLVSTIFYRYLYRNFYSISLVHMSVVYILLSAMALSFLMGIPLLVIGLGMFSGIYMGRRMHLSNSDSYKMFKKVSLFCAVITGFWVLLISIIIMMQDDYTQLLKDLTGLDINFLSLPFSILGIFLLVLLAIFIQYQLTMLSCKWAYKIGR